VPKERRGHTIRRILAFFSPYRPQIGVVLVAILLTSFIGLANPYLLKLLIDEAIPQRDFGLLNLYVGLMIALPIVSGLIGIGQTYLNNVIGQNVMQDLRGALYAHLQRMPLRFFTETRTGEIQSRLANDVGGVQSVVTDTASSVTANVAVALSTVVAMLLIDWRLTALSLGLLPFFMYLTFRVGKVRREVSTAIAAGARIVVLSDRDSNKDLAPMPSLLMVAAVHHHLIREQNRMKVGIVVEAPTIGDIVAFTTLQSRLFFPVGQLLNVQVEIQGALALFDRIFEYLEMDPEIVDAPDAVGLDPAAVRGSVRFHDVSFAYPTEAVPSARAMEAVARGHGHDDSELEPALAAAPVDAPALEAVIESMDSDRPDELPVPPIEIVPQFGLENVDF